MTQVRADGDRNTNMKSDERLKELGDQFIKGSISAEEIGRELRGLMHVFGDVDGAAKYQQKL